MSLLAHPSSLKILNRLSDAPMSAAELVDAIPDVTRASLYRYAELLTRRGAVVQRPRGERRTIDLALTGYGEKLLILADLVQQWFDLRPGSGKLVLESKLGQKVIASRVEGWAQQILWALESQPRSAGRLASQLGAIPGAPLWGFESPSSIRRRVQWMVDTGQIDSIGGRRAGTRIYRPTNWAWLGAGSKAFSIAVELIFRPPESKPPSARVLAFGLVQAGHVLRADEEVSGSLEITIPLEVGTRPSITMFCEINSGLMTAWGTGRAPDPDARGEGPLLDWIGPMVGLKRPQPRVEGNLTFFKAVMAGVRQGMFAPELG